MESTGLDFMSIAMVIFVLWFVMSKRTKESLGSTIQETAGYSSDFMKVQRYKNVVSSTAEVKEITSSSNLTDDDIDAFCKRIGISSHNH